MAPRAHQAKTAGGTSALGQRIALGLLVLPGAAVAADFGVKLEPGVSLPLTAPQSDLYETGGGQSPKVLFGLTPYLDELAEEFGRHTTAQISVRVDDLSEIADTMAALRADPPRTLLGRPATAEDLLPDADVLRWRAEGVRVVVRPSGTEPKLKAYLEVVEPVADDLPAARVRAEGRLAELRAQVSDLLTAP